MTSGAACTGSTMEVAMNAVRLGAIALALALLDVPLVAQQWLRPWCTGNGPADLYANAGTVPTVGTAELDLAVAFCASPTNPATATGVRLRVDYEVGPMTWAYGGFFKLFVEFHVADAGACTPYRDLAVRVYARNAFHCNYITVRNARAVIRGSSLEFPAAGGETTYFADGSNLGPNLWQAVVPQQIVCPATLAAAGCGAHLGGLSAVRGEWPLTAGGNPSTRRCTLQLSGPPGSVVLLYQALDPLPIGVPANAVPVLAPLFRPDCFWFAPAESIPLPTPIVIPWQYVGFYAGLVVLDGGGAATVTHTVPDLTGWIGPAGYEDLLVQGVVLASGAPAPSFGTTQAVRLFVHR
jgi:hypothetical protein